MGEAGVTERGPPAGDGGLEESVRGIRCGVAVAASDHAVSDGRIVAPVATEARSQVDCAVPLSGGARFVEKCRSAAGIWNDAGSDSVITHDSVGDEVG